MTHSLRVLTLVIMAASLALPANFSFTGTFSQDDNVQIFDFTVGAPSNVTLRSYSYAGGTNSAGAVIPAGGFDPILALYDSAGSLIDSQDDAGCPDVPSDPSTGSCYDVLLTRNLVAGAYRVAVMQYDNFPAGPNLSDGFERQGEGNFTGPAFLGRPGSFIDVNDAQRTNRWAFDILNVASASTDVPGQTPIPEPSTLLLSSAGLAVALLLRRK